ncbi:hypothetical protein E4T50_15114 [Aureobasidium sp. EXF-12298]|nr:hypothetical protein E4T50_15114 [Aureobasidium sp. EXF-12298]
MNHPTLSPSTPLEYSLFSPSKAAEQQRLAKDWTYIHHFLAQKYPFPSKVPKFEENEETLKALLALAAYNEKGDEGWSGLCAVEENCVRGMEAKEKTLSTTPTLNTTLTSSLLTNLSNHGTSDLTAQATTAVTLNTTTTAATTLATTLLHLSTSLSTLQNQIAASQSLQSSLLSHKTTLHTELSQLKSPNFQSEKNLPQRTAEIIRQTKLLKAKVAEYDERLRNASASGAEVPEKLLAEVEAANANAEVLMQRLRDVEIKIEEYEGVPPEAREVRRVMMDLRAELEGWVRRRDEMFEEMVGGRR